MKTKELFKFIQERHTIFTRRLAGQAKPWTKDPILQSYRFCNIYRENDTVTQWIAVNWREPFYSDPDLWFAMVVARLINWPESLAAIKMFKAGKVSWDPGQFAKALCRRKDAGEKVFTGAYMIHAGPDAGMGKAGYLADQVLTPMWALRKDIRPESWDTLESFHARLMSCKDMGSFMAGQVVADTKYSACLSKEHTTDWWTWAAMGPGSARGLNRVLGRDVKGTWLQDAWLAKLQLLAAEIAPMLEKSGMPRLHNQDLQNCLCEFDKYERVRLGEGRPRSLYDGA